MKERGYKVHITSDSVSVDHRASFRPRTLVILAVAYVGYCLLPSVRRVLLDFYRTRDAFDAGFAIFFLSIPIVFGLSWVLFASGEVMRCDHQALQVARRRTWGRWHRSHFWVSQVRELKKASRGGNKQRYYTVLTFRAENCTQHDMLEDLSPSDSDEILKACRTLGYDVLIPLDSAAEMNHDIEKRGWLINPLRPD